MRVWSLLYPLKCFVYYTLVANDFVYMIEGVLVEVMELLLRWLHCYFVVSWVVVMGVRGIIVVQR